MPFLKCFSVFVLSHHSKLFVLSVGNDLATHVLCGRFSLAGTSDTSVLALVMALNDALFVEALTSMELKHFQVQGVSIKNPCTLS